MGTAQTSRHVASTTLVSIFPSPLFPSLSLSDFLRVLPLNWTPTVQFVSAETETRWGTRWNPGGKSRKQTADGGAEGIEILRHFHGAARNADRKQNYF